MTTLAQCWVLIHDSSSLSLSLLSVLYLQFSAVDLEQSLFQPFPSEVVFQRYVPCKVYEVPLILRNNDKVSAGMWRFNIVLEGESNTIILPSCIKCNLLQLGTSRIKCLYFARWWKSSHAGDSPYNFGHALVISNPKEFSSQCPSTWKPWMDGNVEGCTVTWSHALAWECTSHPGGCLVSPGSWQDVSASHGLFSCLWAAHCQSIGVEYSLLYAGMSYN